MRCPIEGEEVWTVRQIYASVILLRLVSVRTSEIVAEAMNMMIHAHYTRVVLDLAAPASVLCACAGLENVQLGPPTTWLVFGPLVVH